MKNPESDSAFTQLGRLLVDVCRDLDEYDARADTTTTGLSEFERKLAARAADTTRARRASEGTG